MSQRNLDQSYGSEIHRLKPMQKDYDKKVFDRMYNICKPVIRKLTSQIDAKRFDVSPDVISSYFWDKMLFVFNKYYGTCSEEHLKANILKAMSTYKLHLIKLAYSKQAECNLNLARVEDLREKGFQEVDIVDDDFNYKNKLLDMTYNYMRDHLSPDAWLVFETLTTPPPYIRERVKDNHRITNLILLDFFDLPKTNESAKYISYLRKSIEYWKTKASEELKQKVE